jgi:hypothetical protein
MEAEAAQSRGAADLGKEAGWHSLFELKTNPLRAVLLALVIWFVWWFW